MNSTFRSSVSLILLMNLAACGGASGQQQATPVTIPQTPSPSPTPTTATKPIRQAPSATPNAVAYRAVAAGPLIATVMIDTNLEWTFTDPVDTGGGTNLQGFFGRNIADSSEWRVATMPAQPTTNMAAAGIDRLTGLPYSRFRAPAGATIISPISELIVAYGDETGVRLALGLNSGPLALSSSTNLLTFDPIAGLASSDSTARRDAATIGSINVRLMLLTALFNDLPDSSGTAGLTTMADELSTSLKAHPGATFTDEVVLQDLMQRKLQNFYSSDAKTAAAQYLQRFLDIVPKQLNDDDVTRGWIYAFHFDIMPSAQRIISGWSNMPGSTINQLANTTAHEMLMSATLFMSNSAPEIVDEYIAVPDFIVMYSSSSGPAEVKLSNCAFARLPSCNDFDLFMSSGMSKGVTAVQTGNPAALQVQLSQDGAVTLTQVNGFSGLTSFSYRSKSNFGPEATGKVFVRILP